MLVKACEVELSGDEEQDSAHGFEASVSSCLAFGGLKQAVDGLDKTIGLTRLSPGNDAVEMSTNQSHHVLHLFDLRAHDVGAPLLQHLGHDIDLLALENVAQLLTVQPCAGSTLGGVLTDERLEVGELGEIEFVRVFEQRPTHALELRVELLLLPTHCVERFGRAGDDVETCRRSREHRADVH